MDRHSAEQRRRNMQAVKNRDTAIELALRKELWARGLRYRVNVKSVIGKPDIAFIGKKTAIFCDSEFWHGYDWEKKKKDFKSHQEFWIPKIERNIARDIEVTKQLERVGWIVLRFWGKEIKNNVRMCADKIEEILQTRRL